MGVNRIFKRNQQKKEMQNAYRRMKVPSGNKKRMHRKFEKVRQVQEAIKKKMMDLLKGDK